MPEAALATEAVATPRAAYGTAVAGLATALPDTVVTNDEVAARIG